MAIHPRGHDLHVMENPPLIYEDVWGGRLEKFNCAIDLKAFYMDMYNVFFNNKVVRFLDVFDDEGSSQIGDFFNYQVKKGEHIDQEGNMNRTGDIYEKKFVWNTKPDGGVEMELEWQAYVPIPAHTGYGWIEIKIDLVNRYISQKEVLIGNEKKVLQAGTWEFRNRIKYRNSIIVNKLNKIPFIKDHNWAKSLVIDYLYRKDIEDELDFMEEKIMPLVQGVVNRHFK